MDENLLFYGDNLDVLRRYIKDETVDLVNLDPSIELHQFGVAIYVNVLAMSQ